MPSYREQTNGLIYSLGNSPHDVILSSYLYKPISRTPKVHFTNLPRGFNPIKKTVKINYHKETETEWDKETNDWKTDPPQPALTDR